MIILPDRHNPTYKVLMPVPNTDWRTSSQAQPKDQFGKENRTRFRIRALLNDGHCVWTGWFDDRQDYDAFIWSLINRTLPYEKSLWNLCSPAWYPDLSLDYRYEFVTATFLVSGAGSGNQTYTRPKDWNTASNAIHTIAGGGGGGGGASGSAVGGGGGGGAYARILNLTIGATVTYAVGGAGAAGSTSGSSGTDGTNTYFNGTDRNNSSVGCERGQGGLGSSSGGTGGAGGNGTQGVGSTRYDGGDGSAASGSNSGSGGGAGGPGGAGANASGTTGGTGGGGVTAAGADGVEWSSSPAYGSGGGGNGTSTTNSGQAGGLYGAGGGGGKGGAGTGRGGGAGAQGIIYILYISTSDMLMMFMT